MKVPVLAIPIFLFLSQNALAIRVRIRIPNSGEIVKAVPGVGHIVKKQECDEKNRSLDNRIDVLDKRHAAATANLEQSQKQLESVRRNLEPIIFQRQQSLTVLNDNDLMFEQTQLFVSQFMEIRNRIERLEALDDEMVTNLLFHYLSVRVRLTEVIRQKWDLLLDNLRAGKKDYDEKLKLLKVFLLESGVQGEVLALVQSIQAQGAKIDQTVKSLDALILDMRGQEKEIENDIRSYDEQKTNLMNEMNALRGQHC